MKFHFEFYETINGNCPVHEFLQALRTNDPNDFYIIIEGLKKLEDRSNHREPLSKAIGHGLYELRHVGKLNTRILWFFVKGQRIIAVHGIRNKAKKIRKQDLDTAKDRKRNWEERNKS